MEDTFLNSWMEEIWLLRNQHEYEIYGATFEKRGNELLSKSIDYLAINPELSNDIKIKIKCYQFYLAGFLSGQKMKIYEKIL
jgi:hypothetical protein